MKAQRIFLMNEMVQRRRERHYRQRESHIVSFSDTELRARYRFGRESIKFITDLVSEDISRPTKRSRALDDETQVLIALRYFATGNFQQVIGDTFGVEKSVVSRVINNVSRSLCNRLGEFVQFPTVLAPIKDGFFSKHGFPNIIGCIDGTHVRIIGPRENENDFVNRKGYHSINVQAICDHENRFTNVVARWPGSTHDSRIFRESHIGRQLETAPVNGILLGDSGYACRTFLITPYPNPQTDVHIRFNNPHKRTRSIIERTFGIWKRRFHVLHTEIRLSPERACIVIGACAVLHNIAIMMREPLQGGVNGDDVDDDQAAYQGIEDGKGMRDYIANTFFS